jgi:hypothetical protein
VLEQSKPAVSALTSAETIQAFVSESAAPVTVVAFFNAETSADAKSAFASVADAMRMDGFSFAASEDAAAAQHFNVQGAGVVIFKKFDAPQVRNPVKQIH